MKILFKSVPGWLLLLCLAACHPTASIVSTNRGKYQISAQVPADSAIVKLYLPYKQKVDATMNAVIGHGTQELTKSYDAPETLLGNFFADVSLMQALKIDPSIDFALPSTKGGLRSTLPKGEIRLSHLFELMPFENELMVLTLSGSDIEQLLTFVAESGGQPVAGIRMKIVAQKPTEVLIKGQPFDRSKSYKVLTSDYLANGGDNTKGMNHPLEKKSLGIKVRDALLDYIKNETASGHEINATLDERITKL